MEQAVDKSTPNGQEATQPKAESTTPQTDHGRLDQMDNQEAKELYKKMVLIRRFEEKAAELYAQGKIGGFLHLYIGQEASGVGIISAMKPEDSLITAYRDHGYAIARGLDPKALLAEMLGKVTGVSKGMGGSMHLADPEHNFWGGHAIVGAHIPIATGLALASQYKEEHGVTVCFFGDGAANIGYFHESLNLATVWKLPVLWVIENNQYGMGTAVERASAVPTMVEKACAYNIPAERVDGMDLVAVREMAEKGLDHARSGQGPFLIESVTYRYRGHSMGDPERYRTHEEIEKWQQDDPIGRYRNKLIDAGIARKSELDQIDVEAEAEIAEAVRFAEESPNPTADIVFKDVEVPWETVNQGG